MEWYKQLSIDQKINIKSCFDMLCGMSWESAGMLFAVKERINIMYDKL
jgi:hypothetical protein